MDQQDEDDLKRQQSDADRKDDRRDRTREPGHWRTSLSWIAAPAATYIRG
jgi:hypothetical protein